jgi:hypothetical protein
MFVSNRWFFSGSLKGAHRLGPHLVKVGAQPCHSRGVKLVEPPRACLAVCHQAGILQNAQVLRDGRTAHGQPLRELIYSDGTGGEFLKDSHAGAIAQGIEAGL